MAETTRAVLSICATTSSRLKDLVIKNGQLIFIQDLHRIAFDYADKRTFYNHIEEIATEKDRVEMQSPVVGNYYFVIDTAVLWTYRDEWIQLTTSPKEVVYIGTELPELGSSETLYVKKSGGISVWDKEKLSYIPVADKNEYVDVLDIDALFN